MEMEDLAVPAYMQAPWRRTTRRWRLRLVTSWSALSRARRAWSARMSPGEGVHTSTHRAALAKAKPDVKCLVVGNPANTNACILSQAAPAVPKKNITALTRLDHNRARMALALKSGKPVEMVEGVMIWGNHSSTQYPDVRNAKIDGVPAMEAIPDTAWLEGEYISTIQKRGAGIIAARKLSSAASAAKAICDHLRTGSWAAAGTSSRWSVLGRQHLRHPRRAVYPFPVTCEAGTWSVVENLPVDAFSREKMDATAAELVEEKEIATSLIGS